VSAVSDDVLGTADAVEIARRIRSGQIQAREAVEAAIARAQRVNPALNAIATPLFESALEEAGRPGSGAFAGVPSFIKDNEAVAGSPVLHGSRGLPKQPSERSSPFVEQFLSLGLINLGKTTMPEFGLTGTTEALVYGRTHNPWKLGFSPGGSSGGSAALVAAGVVPIAHGNDGGGSTRIPASCCGLVGLKPSRGRLKDIEGAAFFPVKIVHQGMLSRSVRDTAVFYQSAEEYYRNSSLPEIGEVTHPGRRLRVGFFANLDEATPSHPDCVEAVTNAAKLLENLGHSVEPVARPFDDGFLEDFFLLWAMLSFTVTRFGKLLVHPDFDRSKVEDFTEGLARYFKENAQNAPAALPGRFSEALGVIRLGFEKRPPCPGWLDRVGFPAACRGELQSSELRHAGQADLCGQVAFNLWRKSLCAAPMGKFHPGGHRSLVLERRVYEKGS